MQYLILENFLSFGKRLLKGTVVDAENIRSPRLRESEGKLVPAVSSSEVPVEFGAEDPAPQGTSRNKNKKLSLSVNK